jgi:hypothetical protein
MLIVTYLAVCRSRSISHQQNINVPCPPRGDTDLLSAQELTNGRPCDVTVTGPALRLSLPLYASSVPRNAEEFFSETWIG